MVHITAHSGCDGTPDNSLEFVRHALQTNADALEVDVRKTKDGILAISHDAILDDQDAPALDAVFALVAQTDKWINCDLKEPDLENAVIDLARFVTASYFFWNCQLRACPYGRNSEKGRAHLHQYRRTHAGIV